MPPLEITDDHRERIERLREELADRHAGPYATVGTEEVLSYLLDLAEAVDDPDRSADPDRLAGGEDEGDSAADEDSLPFDREAAREALGERNRKHGDPEQADRSDLYSIAAAFDVSGRSDMTKDELVEAILDAAAELAVDPFARVDVEVPDADPANDEHGDAEAASEAGEDPAPDDPGDGGGDDAVGNDGTSEDDGGAGQLNAMMSLLDTHDDKWHEGDGDVRYEVELPDGSVETARTKDDVRALLFRNY
ncbi:Rho termination factor, N-terminal domain [Halorubrum aquaticum]|uniref:Rho termination factor, N-terminal domain n=2 Tax=Halorubrum aquaticum TaxID=387340 RepID=A0A1I3CZN6_9EURY|nr:Rho termination factor N-terminal domain-containing protein [Halorubrum aquaticum]SFH79922.1 Rho termination factor, N-terminal domain [Halorubrum aquaticum]